MGIKELMSHSIALLEMNRTNSDGLTGVPSGLGELDRITGGFQNGNLIILAGAQSMGKSTLAYNICTNASVDFGKQVALFSMQQTSVEIANKLISCRSEIELTKILKQSLADYEWDHIAHKTAALTEAPLFIDDTARLTTKDLAEKAKKLKEDHDIQFLIVDDIHSMTLTDDQRRVATSREQEVSIIVRELKALAKELHIPVLGVSQVSRSLEIRGGDRRPRLIDLRDSGALENDSDMVLFLYRPEHYGIMESEEGMPMQGVAEIEIAKFRNGPLDTFQIKYIAKYCMFCDLNVREAFNPSLFNPKLGGGTMTFGSKVNNGEKDAGSPGFGYTSSSEDDEAPF